MPAKKRKAPPAKKRKAAPAQKKRRTTPPAKKRRAAAPAKKPARAGRGDVPAAVRRAAERNVARYRDEREAARPIADASRHGDAAHVARGAVEVMAPTGSEEPEALRDVLAEASAAGPVIEERRAQATGVSASDTMTWERDEHAPTPRGSAGLPPSAGPRPGGGVVIDVQDLHVFYGAVEALKGISFRVDAGETVSIIGSNGAGKTTTLKTVSGVSELLKSVRGRITILGKRVDSWPAHRIAKLGVAHSPEGRKVFPNQTVRDNLMLGAFGRKDAEVENDIQQMEARFPILGQRRNQPAGLMSGGEQQMLAMARALMARPQVLLFDEPSMGLAPLIVKQIFEIIEELKREGKTILLVEQMAFQALGIADRAYVLETGAITMEGRGRDLLEDPRVKEAYLGA